MGCRLDLRLKKYAKPIATINNAIPSVPRLNEDKNVVCDITKTLPIIVCNAPPDLMVPANYQANCIKISQSPVAHRFMYVNRGSKHSQPQGFSMPLLRKFWLKPKMPATPSIRDTNLDWQVIGAKEPFFGVLSNERFRPENLTEEAIEEFYRTGSEQVEELLNKMQRLGPFDPKSALDFGCGVGRLSIPLTHITGCVVGVDISPGMIAEAQKRAPDGLTFATDIPERSFDWVVSIIVFQHIPPARGLAQLHTMLSRLSPDGGATIQFMFARTDRHKNSLGTRTLIGQDKIETYPDNGVNVTVPNGIILMYDYDMSAVLAEMFAVGMRNLAIEYCDHGGHIGATIFGIKGS
jgi:SAM-dependent methyltransferase